MLYVYNLSSLNPTLKANTHTGYAKKIFKVFLLRNLSIVDKKIMGI